MTTATRSQGFTLVEMLIALAIFGTVVAITTAGIGSTLMAQSSNESASATQAKLRRVTEVFTQELRSAVLGGLTTEPYTPGPSSISFMLLDGGAGYQVLPGSGNFRNQSSTRIVAPVASAAETGLLGGSAQALIVNSEEQGYIFGVSDVTRVGGSGSVEYSVAHAGCTNGIDFEKSVLLFQVRTLGFYYDADARTLYQQVTGSTAAPVAFDIDMFELEYVYVQDGNDTPIVRTTPVTDASGIPARKIQIGGVDSRLARIRMIIGSGSIAGTSDVSRTYSGTVELPTNQSYEIEKVAVCS